MSVTRRPSVRRAAARSRRAPHLHVLELEGRLAPAVFDIPNGDVAAFVAAVNACNTNNQPDVINLAANGTYTFTTRVDNDTGGTALPIVRLDGGNQKNSLTINGHGATVQRSSAPGTPGFRFLRLGPGDGARIQAVDTVVSELTVRGFDVTAMTTGGVPMGSAILSIWANLRLTNCVMTGNASTLGGAVTAYGPRTFTVSLDRCVITSDVSTQGGWGSINVQGPILSVSNCLIANGTGGNLSGIMYSGGDSCTITDSVVRDYPWTGLFILSNLTMRGCTISGNRAGGLRVEGSDLTVSDCAFTGNVSGRGGGIALYAHRATISNTTFDGNQAGRGGGIAILREDGVTIIGIPEVLPDVSIFGCTITGNRAESPSYLQPGNPNLFAFGGGVWLEAGSLRIESTVIAGNSLTLGGKPGDGPDISGNVASLLYSFIGNGSGMTLTGPSTGSRIGTAAVPLDPQLGPIGNNGGPTLTRLPLAGSPLVNAGDPNFTPPPQFDQRGPGFPRVSGGRIDIGATEKTLAHDLAVTLTDGRRVVPAGGTATYTAVVQNAGDFPESGRTFTVPVPPGAATMTWTSTAARGATGNTPSGTGPISETLDLPLGASVAYTVTVTLSPTAAGQLVATAQAAAPTGVSDGNPSNNAATDTDAILVGGRILAVGMGAGGPPEVKLFGARDGAPLYSFAAYDPAFRGGVSVAVADFNADGVPDVVTAAGPGGGPHVRVFDGATGAVLREWFAYDSTFFGGVFVAAGDVTGDGTPDVVTGAGAGGGPHVKVFNGTTGALVSQWMAYDAAFRGGVSVAAGDVDGDNRADVVTGAGPGGGPHVKVFGGATGALLTQAFAYEADFRGGVWVSVGDVDGDGRAEVITAPGEGGGPFVKVLRGSDLSLFRGFFAYAPALRSGARVAAVDATGDGRADIATAAGPGRGPHVKLFDGDTGAEVYGLMAFDPAVRGGIFVGAG